MADDGATTSDPEEEEKRRRRRPIAWWWWAGGAGLVAAVVAALLLSGGGDDGDEGVPASDNGGSQSVATATPAPSDGTAASAPSATDAGPAVRPGIEGIWEFIVKVTETSGACAGEEDEEPGIDNVTIRRADDGTYSVTGLGSTPDSEWAGWWEDDSFIFAGQRDEDGGVTDARFQMTMTEDGAFHGTEEWSWSSASEGECPDGASDVEAYFYSPLN